MQVLQKARVYKKPKTATHSFENCGFKFANFFKLKRDGNIFVVLKRTTYNLPGADLTWAMWENPLSRFFQPQKDQMKWGRGG